MTPGTVYREHSHIRGVSGQRDWSSLAQPRSPGFDPFTLNTSTANQNHAHSIPLPKFTSTEHFTQPGLRKIKGFLNANYTARAAPKVLMLLHKNLDSCTKGSATAVITNTWRNTPYFWMASSSPDY
ncbi:hypothetical protein Bbelb_368810 [Branchiostoma belcheri]|nr:hypothetical protein Bbelb_368810 [Branchiostoma belcheri]